MMMWFLCFVAAAPCAELGEKVLLKDGDGLLRRSARVTAASPVCERYLRALALQQQKGDSAEAKRLWQSLAAAPAPLGDWVKLESARHAWRAHTPELAIAGEPSAAFAQAFELQVLRLVLNKDANAWAKTPIEPLPEHRRIQLEWLAELGIAEARRELFIEFPDSKVAPLAFPAASLNDLVRRAAVATDKHMNADVLKTVAAARALQPTPADQCALAFYEGAAQRKLRKYTLAETALLQAISLCGKGELRKRAFYLLGQVQIIARPLATASATLNEFAREYPSDALTDDALFGVAVATAKAGNKEEALRLYERVRSLETPGDMCAEASFRAAYGAYQAGRYDDASARFAALAAGSCGVDDYERARGAYWQARAVAQTGKPAEKLFVELAHKQPLTFYGLMARLRTGGAGFSLPAGEGATAAVVSAPALVRADALSALGLYREAQAELLAYTPDTLAEAQLAYAGALARAKQYHRSSWVLRTGLKSALQTRPVSRADVAWNIAYPRPFIAEIAAAEKREQLEADFLLALIREESAFQIDAGSSANAFGLTQLLVETAVAAAKDAKREDMPTAEALRESPVLAIDLGAHHLRTLARKYKHPALILASYNAGQGNVSKWVEARGDKPFDEFLEEIPLDETRGYVKRILRTWAIYRALAGKPLPRIDLGAMKKS